MDGTEQRGSRIKDARGRVVRQLDPVMLHVLHRYETVEAHTLEQIVEDLEPGTAKLRRRMIVIIPVCIAAFVLGLAALYYFSDASARRDLVSTLLNPAIMVPNLVCCLLVPWIVTRQARSNRIRFAMLKHRRCPHCAYDIRGLPSDPEDGATVCPECGCAWLLDDALIAEGLSSAAATGSPGPEQKRRNLTVTMVVLGLCALLGVVMLIWRR